MKKLFLILSISLVSFNAYSVEHVIGIGGFSGNYETLTDHSLSLEHKNPNYDPLKPIDDENQERITSQLSASSRNKNAGYNINFEYQARFDAPFLIGFGFENNKISINPDYQNLNKFDYQVNTPYFISMITLNKNRYTTIRLGLSAGVDFISADTKKSEKFNLAFLVDGELNITKQLMVYSRLSYIVTEKYAMVSDTDLLIDNSYEDVVELSNSLSITPVYDLLKINFGVRYKI